jgi:hypothetical protein
MFVAFASCHDIFDAFSVSVADGPDASGISGGLIPDIFVVLCRWLGQECRTNGFRAFHDAEKRCQIERP